MNKNVSVRKAIEAKYKTVSSIHLAYFYSLNAEPESWENESAWLWRSDFCEWLGKITKEYCKDKSIDVLETSFQMDQFLDYVWELVIAKKVIA